MSKQRLIDIDRAKGLGIFLVVLGHIVAREAPKGNEWWYGFKYVIYTFHMPFLMCLSGIVLAYTWKPIDKFLDYRQYVAKKFMRLIPVFTLFATIIFLGKYFTQNYMHVDNHVNSLNELLLIFLRPNSSFSTYLWYIYTLFIIYLIVPSLLKFSSGRICPLLCFSLLIYSIPTTDYFSLRQVSEYLFIFLIGMHIGRNYEEFCNITIQDRYIYLFVFIASLIFISFIPRLVVSVLSIPALISFVKLPLLKNDKLLKILGQYIFPIYLMNTMAIGGVKAVMLKVLPWDYTNFFYYLPILFLSGIFLPIMIKKYILFRIKTLDKIIA